MSQEGQKKARDSKPPQPNEAPKPKEKKSEEYHHYSEGSSGAYEKWGAPIL